MITITNDKTICSFSGTHTAVATACSGDTVRFETVDCFNNQLTSEKQSIHDGHGPFVNPATGPLYVKGAEPGDLLKIHIVDIQTAEWGVMTTDSKDELLGSRYQTDCVKIIPIKNNMALFNDKLQLPLRPMIGVIGVAPEGEAISTVDPGTHGGNMDCKHIVAGSILYLPVKAQGGLLAMGDLHALMGDGETGGCGLEVSGAVTVKVEVVKQNPQNWPMLVQDDKLMIITSELTIEEANTQAIHAMHDFLVKELGMNAHDAGFIISLVGDLAVCQIVDPLKTARMEVPMSLLRQYGYTLF